MRAYTTQINMKLLIGGRMQRYYSCWTRSSLPVRQHIWKMCLHEQRDRPPPPGGESKGGIKGKGICCMVMIRQTACSPRSKI
jgi:hypothetical protein